MVILILFEFVLNQVELIPVKNESNVVVLYICTFRDITSFKVKLMYDKLSSVEATTSRRGIFVGNFEVILICVSAYVT